jgi:hypothetical protein
MRSVGDTDPGDLLHGIVATPEAQAGMVRVPTA